MELLFWSNFVHANLKIISQTLQSSAIHFYGWKHFFYAPQFTYTPYICNNWKGGRKNACKRNVYCIICFLKNFDFLPPSSSEVDLNVKITFFKISFFIIFQFYPDEDHFLSGVKVHLYESVTNFLGKCFAKFDQPFTEDS